MQEFSYFLLMMATHRPFHQPSAIHIVTPTLVERFKLNVPVHFHLDSEVLPGLLPSEFKIRPNWMYQQMLKLLQDITETDWFQVIDSDVFVIKNISLEDKGRPVFLLGLNQMLPDYFNFNNRLFGFGKTYPWSFLSELTLYNKRYLAEIRNELHVDRVEFFRLCAQIVNEGKNGHPADAELYGSWVYKHYPRLYTFKHVKVQLGGRYNSGQYSWQEIEAAIKERTPNPDIDVFQMNSWEGRI